MILSLNFIFAYLLGGLTLIPILITLIIIVYFIQHNLISPIQEKLSKSRNVNEADSPLLELPTDEVSNNSTTTSHLYKVGWLKASRENEQILPDSTLGTMVVSYISGKKKATANIYFAVLKYNTLYLYDSEKQLDSKGVITLNGYQVTTYPPGLQDFELFSKPNLIKLQKEDSTYFFNCNRCIDKEDWFFTFIKASKMQGQQQEKQIAYKTHFDQTAMNHLIAMLHSDEHHFQTQWLNALLGRMFFGVYKTQDVKNALYKKVNSKLDKINSKRPPFLGEITVRSVDPGHSLPYFTQPKLLGLSPTGELTGEAYFQYDGGFRVEIETSLNWKYSDRLKPLTLDLVLGITLKEIQGKILIKIKEPPTNRFWYSFYECPKMEWKVEPLVWEKKIGYSVVVKAIETQIQQFISETMVLPNFDDIVFFPSHGAGGIFDSPIPSAEPMKQEDSIPAKDTEEVKKKDDDSIKDEVSVNEETIPTEEMMIPLEQVPSIEKITDKGDLKRKKTKKENQEHRKKDEALLTTAKSLPELFSAQQQQQQQQQSSRLREVDFYQHQNISSEPTMITKNINISCSPSLVPSNDSASTVIPITSTNNNHINNEDSFLSTSPDSLLSSSPSSSTIEDSLRTLSNVLTDDKNIIVSPSNSTLLETCDSAPVQITYSQDYTNHHNEHTTTNNNARLRKSSSLALLRPKTGASTAINVSPAMAHKKPQKDMDSISTVVI